MNDTFKNTRNLPQAVIDCAINGGEISTAWLNDLENLIAYFEEKWQIKVGNALHGGSRSFVGKAVGVDKKEYILKLEIPESIGNAEFSRGIDTLKLANANGYARLYKFDLEKKACLLEALGETLGSFDYSTNEKIKMICEALIKSWGIDAKNNTLPTGKDCTAWYEEFILESAKSKNPPCDKTVVEKAVSFVGEIEKNFDPKACVLIHGDAHAGNILQSLSGEKEFKFIDPDGAYYDKSADLGVIMREWHEEYEENPIEAGVLRCEYLSALTGVSKKKIWQWGFIQTVSTAFVLYQNNSKELCEKMLKTAKAWCAVEFN